MVVIAVQYIVQYIVHSKNRRIIKKMTPCSTVFPTHCENKEVRKKEYSKKWLHRNKELVQIHFTIC